MKRIKNMFACIVGLFSVTPTKEYGIIPLLLASGASLIGGIASAVNKNNLANEQNRRAKKLISDAQNVKRAKEDDLFEENKNIALKKLSLGLPAKNVIQDQLDSTTANNIAQARVSTNNSGDLLSAVSASNKVASDNSLKLGISDAQYKDQALDEVSLNNQRIALERARLESIAEQKRQQLRGQAGALENAATQNKANATDEIISGVTNAATTLAGSVKLKKKKVLSKVKSMKDISQDITNRSMPETQDITDLK